MGVADSSGKVVAGGCTQDDKNWGEGVEKWIVYPEGDQTNYIRSVIRFKKYINSENKKKRGKVIKYTCYFLTDGVLQFKKP